MVLYKYMKAEHALKTFTDKTLKFSRASTFNDPFEYNACLTIEPEDDIRYLATIEHEIKIGADQSSFLLCLTRSPLNLIMWAHYAECHEGVVLGLEVDSSFFTDASSCVVPIQYGNVIYTKTKPAHLYKYPDLEFGSPIFTKFSSDFLECLQRIYLYKSVDWAYEEEVRLVKPKSEIVKYDPQWILNGNGQIQPQCAIIRIPDLKIKEIYLGSRINPEIAKEVHVVADQDVKIYNCSVSSRYWGLDINAQGGY
jgi:hypothetical protein